MKPLTFYIFVGFLLFSTKSAFAVLSAAIPTTRQQPAVIDKDNAAWRREPFIKRTQTVAASKKSILNGYKTGKPIKTAVKNEEEIDLQGIMLVDNRYHALINGRTVKAGNKIAGVTIKKIERYAVVVQNEKNEKIVYDIYQGKVERGKK